MNKQKTGFSLVELSIAIGVMAIVASAIVPIAIRTVQIKAADKTALEMAMIQDAARNYYLDNSSWPADLEELRSKAYLNPTWNANDPWQNPYQISSTSLQMTVSADVPSQWANLVASHLPAAVVNNTRVTSTISSLNSSVVTPGIIVAWSGAIADIPTGWALCDGTNGTPDLREKFIVGARQDDQGFAKSSITGPLLQIGGSVTHNHSGITGSHVLTVAEIPPHSHNIDANDNSNTGGGVRPFLSIGPSHVNLTTASAGGGLGHTHSISTDYNVPPFYALAFIMKV